jgi:3-isopropylmalate/(R)-2-methylmalate dehydratase small subunit
VDKATHGWLVENPGVEVTIDVTACKLHLPDGRAVSFPIDGFSKYCLLNGVDQLGYLLDQADAITHYENTRPWKP